MRLRRGVEEFERRWWWEGGEEGGAKDLGGVGRLCRLGGCYVFIFLFSSSYIFIYFIG